MLIYTKKDYGPMYKAEVRVRTTGRVSSALTEEEDEPDHEVPPILKRQSPAIGSQEQPDDLDGLSVIEQARIVEFKDVLAWVSRKTVFTTGKPWADAQSSDQPIRMACQDILQPPGNRTRSLSAPHLFSFS